MKDSRRNLDKKKKKDGKKKISLRAYLLSSFALFLCMSIFITWVFQVVLLDSVFRNVKKIELKNASKAVEKVIGTEQMEEVASEKALESLMCIEIYKIDGSYAQKICFKDATSSENDVAPFIPPDTMTRLYESAKNNGGQYQTEMMFGGKEIQSDPLETIFASEKEKGDSRTQTRKIYNLVQASVCEGADGTEYMILLRSSSIPLLSTSTTLRRQFFWITSILLIAALLLSLPISNRIARPLRQMNEEAKRLATGNYDVHFYGSGYRETENLAESLDYAASELAKTDRLQKELIANISHDLRTPLTMIRGYGEAMRDIPGENSPENVQVIIDEAEHLSELVNDLLDLSRLQSGVRSPVMEQFNLTLAIRETIARYEAFTRNQGFSIALRADRNIFVFADRGMILQVLYNLMNNAINYSGESKRVEIHQTIYDGKVRIDVVDFGEGIPKEQIPLIWDRYYKVDKVHKMAMVGTGLGLSIVKGVLESHKASYGVESEIGKGSDFWFELPVMPEVRTRDLK